MSAAYGHDTAAYRRIVAALRTETRRRGLPCWLCGQRIPFDVPADDPEAFSADHVQPVSTHPWLAEDPTNLKPSHRRCNVARGNRPPPAGLGDTGDRDW